MENLPIRANDIVIEKNTYKSWVRLRTVEKTTSDVITLNPIDSESINKFKAHNGCPIDGKINSNEAFIRTAKEEEILYIQNVIAENDTSLLNTQAGDTVIAKEYGKTNQKGLELTVYKASYDFIWVTKVVDGFQLRFDRQTGKQQDTCDNEKTLYIVPKVS